VANPGNDDFVLLRSAPFDSKEPLGWQSLEEREQNKQDPIILYTQRNDPMIGFRVVLEP